MKESQKQIHELDDTTLETILRLFNEYLASVQKWITSERSRINKAPKNSARSKVYESGGSNDYSTWSDS